MNEETPPQGEEQQRQAVRVQLPDRKPIVTIILTVITSVIFIVQYLVQISTGYDLLFSLAGRLMNSSCRVRSGVC